ncbi:uncharacterized protein LOC129773662 [Toxorhynchites rutilus septentrionalis]|uniref:uncharacterized protein LOC129773662 n=1 Tax=Toxorhynchites rutilus septentrionalis TaxID=329112 RepID=UPI002478CDAD|nr:uncharacterized protein LOC129773662 [Toxorhynchites rutilus septentrionalis]
MFESGGFHLRKWASNCTAALAGVPILDIEVNTAIDLDDSTTIKALGMHWQPCSDEFKFVFHQPEISQHTKRIILSQIASLFDPLGLLAPVIVKAKLVMQKLWELRVDWDANPPGELTTYWHSFVQHLSVLNNFQVPRRVIGGCKPHRIYLHGYSDASERAIGACVYIRTIDEAGNLSSHLLCSKSKLAPIGNHRTTLPRLELCASVLLARLIANVQSIINVTIFEIHAWTDSQVVLAWLKGGASKWKTFVANRVAEITTHLPAINWDHINTQQNPADLISRGAIPEQLRDNSLWWNGPVWSPKSGHSQSTDSYVSSVTLQEAQQIGREQKTMSVSLIAAYQNSFLDNMMTRFYPDLLMLLRVTARLLRFRYYNSRENSRLLPYEIERALRIYVKHIQQLHFGSELLRLQQKREVSRHSSLNQLKPMLDECGLIRVGGRLQHSGLSYDVIHPILLPRQSILTFLILQYDHATHHHCGPQTLLAVSRRRFWIIRGASTTRKVYRQCIICAKAKPAPVFQQMGQLPSDRVQPHPPFSITGVDYAGPLDTVGRRARGAILNNFAASTS